MNAGLRISRAGDLDRAAILAVAAGRQVELAGELRAAVATRRSDALSALADGRAVYGVNTGMGAQSSVSLTADEQGRHQNNLLLARAVGGPPWLSRAAVRALFAVRLRTFLSGDAGVSADLIDLLVSFLNADVLPAVPRSSYGSSGEIIPLAHAFGPLTGVGSVLKAGNAVDAAEVVRSTGLASIVLGAKEGVALLQGVPGTAAQALLLAEEVDHLIAQSITVVALGLAASSAPQDVYSPELTRGDPELAAVNNLLLARLAGTDSTPRSLQAPVSFRVAGTVLAHLTRSVIALRAAVDRALHGVTDSPAFVGGRFHSTAGFHGLDLAATLDAVSVALVHASEVSAARTHRLLDARFTGLPAQLAANVGADAGLVAVHKRAAGVVHQLRRTTSSSVVGLIETSFGQEDVQSFSWEAAANARTASEGATDVLACELLTASHALTLSGRATGAALASALGSVRGVVEPIVADRPFGRDIDALRRLLLGDGLTST